MKLTPPPPTPRSQLGEATALYLHTFVTPLPTKSGILPLFVYKLSCRRTGSCCFNRCKAIFLFEFQTSKKREIFVFSSTDVRLHLVRTPATSQRVPRMMEVLHRDDYLPCVRHILLLFIRPRDVGSVSEFIGVLCFA